MSTKTEKIKESVKKSIKTKKSKKTEPLSGDDLMEAIGLPKSSERPKEVTVYTLTYHNRARLDHVKYPNEHMRRLENSPYFATWDDAHKECRKREKEDPENLYFSKMTSVPERDVPKAILKKIKERGW